MRAYILIAMYVDYLVEIIDFNQWQTISDYE